MTDYLTVADILAIHDDLIERYGGAHGVRDAWRAGIGALPSADWLLRRPDREAAALWESLSQNHPFIDGNKRAAFAAVYTFLAINGLELKADPEETYAFIIGLFENQTFDFVYLDAWLRAHVTGR